MECAGNAQHFVKPGKTFVLDLEIKPAVNKPVGVIGADTQRGSKRIAVRIGAVLGGNIFVIGKIIEPKADNLALINKVQLGDERLVFFLQIIKNNVLERASLC